jgi:hypothetical protein
METDGVKIAMLCAALVAIGEFRDTAWGMVLAIALALVAGGSRAAMTAWDHGMHPLAIAKAVAALAIVGGLGVAVATQPLAAVALAVLAIAWIVAKTRRAVATLRRTALNPYYREYAHPLALALAPKLDLDPSRPRHWIAISRRWLDGGIAISLPQGPALTPAEQKQLEEQADTILELEPDDREYRWDQGGRRGVVRIVAGLPPLESRIPLTAEHLAVIAKAPIHRMYVGEQRGGRPWAFDLKLNPHPAIFARTGWGKSDNVSLMVAQWLHKGGEVLVLDVKFASLRHLMDLPGVTYANTPELIHNVLSHALTQEVERRKQILGDTHWTEHPDFPPLLVVGEELVAQYDELKAYWVQERQRIKAETGTDPGAISPAMTGWRHGLLLGRQLGIHLIPIAQRGDAIPLGGGGARQQMDPRVFGLADRQAWQLAAGDHRYRPGKGQGHAWVIHGAQIDEVQFWHGEYAQLRDFATSGKPPARTLERWTTSRPRLDLDVGQPVIEQMRSTTTSDHSHPAGDKLSDIARVTGVKLSSLRKWSQRDDFPAALGERNAAKLYDTQEVQAWLTSTGRTGQMTTG